MSQAVVVLGVWLLARVAFLKLHPLINSLFIFEVIAILIALAAGNMWSFFVDKDMVDADAEDMSVAISETVTPRASRQLIRRKDTEEEQALEISGRTTTPRKGGVTMSFEEDDDNTTREEKVISSKVSLTTVSNGLEAMDAAAGTELPHGLKVELGKLIDFVVRDYVSSWYSLLSDDAEFESDVRLHLATVLTQVGQRCLDRLNFVAFALDTVADAATLQLKAHGEARASARQTNAKVFEKKEISIEAAQLRNHATLDQLAAKDRLHPAISWKGSKEDKAQKAALSSREKKYLRHASSRLLRLVAPGEDLGCRAVRHLLRELLVNAILGVAISLISEPSNLATWINLAKNQQEQDHVTSIMEEAQPKAEAHQPTAPITTNTTTPVIQPGRALPGFKETPAWRFFCGALDAEEAASLTAEAKEGSYIIRAEPGAESRAPNEPVDIILSYVAQPGAVCSVVFFAEPALVDGDEEAFAYMRFSGGARDPRLLDRANQFEATTSLDSLLETQFQDVAFRGIDCRSKDEIEKAELEVKEEILDQSEEVIRKRTPMPHESEARLFAEQVRHVLLIELQAAVEMAEDFSTRVNILVQHAQQNKPNSLASSLKRGLGEAYLSKEAQARAQARRDAMAMQEMVQMQVKAWSSDEGIRAVHRLLSALDACFAHTGQDDSGQAAYAAYFEQQENIKDLDEEQQRAAGLAWLFNILESCRLHAIVYDACADTKLTARHYGIDAILREPSDLARFLWFSERIDTLAVKPYIPGLVALDEKTYSLAASLAAKAAAAKVASVVADDENPTATKGIYSVSIMALAQAAISSTNVETSLEAPVDRKKTGQKKKGRDELIDKSRAAAARATSMQSSQNAKHEACRLNYLLKRRPSRSSLIEYGLLNVKTLAPNAVSVKVVVAEDARSVQSIIDKSSILDTLVTTLSGNSGTTVASAPVKNKQKIATTYYQVWLLAGNADNEKKPIVVPVSKKRAYTRRRYSDFRALRLALASATRRPLPRLPPRRIAERLYTRAKAAHEARRSGLEAFLLGLLSDTVLRHSHELRSFLFDSAADMRTLLRASYDTNKNEEADRSYSDAEGESDDDDDDDSEDESDDSEDEDDQEATLLTSTSSAVNEEKEEETIEEIASQQQEQDAKAKENSETSSSMPPRAREISTAAKKEANGQADWRRLKRVEHRTYMLLRELFDVDHMGLMRRNFVALLRRGARALWSPAMATWLGSKTARDARLRLLTSLTAKLNDLVWPNGQSRLNKDQKEDSNVQEEKEAALIALRQDLASAIPASLASLVGQSAADDAVSKLHDLLLCPTQLRSLSYTILDLLLIELFPELELVLGGLDHLCA